MDDNELKAAMARARAEANERIELIDADLMPKVIAAELRGYSGDYQPKPKPPAPMPRAEVEELVGRTVADFSAVTLKHISDVAMDIHRRYGPRAHGSEVDALNAKVAALELRIDALAHEASKRQTIEAAAEVIDLPNVLRGRRAG